MLELVLALTLGLGAGGEPEQTEERRIAVIGELSRVLSVWCT